MSIAHIIAGKMFQKQNSLNLHEKLRSICAFSTISHREQERLIVFNVEVLI